MENHTYYSQRIELCQEQLRLANRKYRLIGILRLFSFFAFGLSIYLLWGSLFVIIPASFFLVLFLFLVSLSAEAKYKRDKQQKLIEINISELQVLNGNWQHYKDGNEYKDDRHPFAHDMDLFGKKSIYQLLNRTVTKKASDQLSNQLKKGTNNPQLCNDAIIELSKNMDWCQEFLAEGMVFSEEDLKKEFEKINTIETNESWFLNLIRIIIPICSITITTLYYFDLVSGVFFGIYVAAVFSIIGRNLKSTNFITTQVTSYASQVKMYQRQMNLYAVLNVSSDLLKAHRIKLLSEQNSLIDTLQQLEKIQSRMDTRMNLLVGTMLNFFLAWDFQVLYQWRNWRNNEKKDLENSVLKLAQLEVWISGAVYRFNYPESTFSKFSETSSIHINGLGHPFVPSQKRVLNNIEWSEKENFLIITGPNMAGKSTFLRSLGLAFICANAGFPVMAESCMIPRLNLYTSMRTADDLTVESSYFHAELTRLRFIMDAIERGERVFIILDEILKGTNSKDKEIGSAKFLQKLERLQSKGVIATHDLSLCNLAEENSSFRNMYFDSTIQGNELSFDYKIREGICKNMNASFLLKQMNLVD